MRVARPAELVVGTSNSGTHQVPAREVARNLVSRAAEAGIEKFQTARANPATEQGFGAALAGRKAVRTITGLSPLDDVPPHAIAAVVRAKVDESVAHSLASMQRDTLDCVMLQRARHRTAWHGAAWDRLIEFLEEGVILSLGVAVDTPAEALAALSCADVQHIQLPFNILDWRWRAAGVIARLTERNAVTVHARNVFLDGLLTAADPFGWPRLPGLNPAGIIDWLEETARFHERDGAADLCLAFARGQSWIDGIVIGMDTEDELDATLRLSALRPLSEADCLAIETTRPHAALALLDPAQWPRALA
jgi:aryl-alcohol dehydrogenase-like predicted oxidoreductase